MNILIVSELWWPEPEGGGTLAHYLVTKLLRDAGCKITIVHGARNPKTIRGVNFVYTNHLDMNYLKYKYGLWLHCILLSREHWLQKLLQKADIIYIPGRAYPLIPLAKRMGKKTIVHLHDYQPLSFNANIFNGSKKMKINDIVKLELLEHEDIVRAILSGIYAPVNILSRMWLSYADKIICVSKRQAEIISKFAPELASKITVIYNPLPSFPPPRDKFFNPTFIYAGGGSYVKGFYIFLQLALVLLKEHDVNFLLTGKYTPAQRKMLMKVSKVFTDRFKCLASIPYENVLNIYSKSWAMIVPSIWEETFGYTVAEAMAMGTIPIASRIGGIPEIVEGTYAEKMLFTPGSIMELSRRIESVLGLSKGQLRDIGIELREKVLKKFNKHVVKEKLLREFAG